MTTVSTDQTQTDQAVPLDDEARQLKLQQMKAESRKAIAEAEKNRLSAMLPTGEAKSNGGKIEIGSSVGLVADLLSHELVDAAAEKLVTAINNLIAGGNVLVVDDIALIGTDWPYWFINTELANQTTALKEIVDALKGFVDGAKAAAPPPGREGVAVEEFVALPIIGTAALATAQSMVAGVASVFSMFKSDYAISSREVKLGLPSLIAGVVRRLNLAKVAVTVDRFRVLGESPVIVRYGAACKIRADLESLRSFVNENWVLTTNRQLDDRRLELKTTAEQLAAAKTTPARSQLNKRLAELRQQIRTLEIGAALPRSLVRTGDAIASRFDTFASSVTATPANALYPPLVAAAVREQLHLKGGITHVLLVGVEAAGGEVVSVHAPFWKGDHIDFLGGCAVFYLLYSIAEDRTIASDVYPLMSRLRWNLGSGKSEGVELVDVKPTSDY
jgi:hypothetical protein